MKKLSLLLVTSLFCLGAEAQNANRNKFITDSLDNLISKSLTNWRVPGAAVCIVKDGRIILRKGYGIKELGVAAKVDENTLFMIGSNTKAFTATALATLQAQGKVSLDDRVTKYVPEFKLESKEITNMVTLRDLLSHRIGFGTFQGDFTYWTSDLTREQVIEKMSHVKPLYPFRSRWGYTNAAFLTAGEAIERITKKKWEQYIKETIFAPLGMSSTVALSKDLSTSFNKAAAHTFIDGRLAAIPYPQIDNLAPAGSISSSANDMCKWLLALLANGKTGQREVIPAAAIRATRQPQILVGGGEDGGFSAYGLGWFLQGYKGHRVVMHTGGVNGYVSSVTLVPDQNLGIVILTNNDQNNLIETLNLDIIDAYIKQPFRSHADAALTETKAYQQRILQREKSWRDSTLLNLRPALSIGEYTGKYTNDLYGNITISKGDAVSDLEVRFEHHPKLFARLQPLGGNRFFATFSDPEFGRSVFPFTVQGNKVVGVQVKVADFVELTPYEFKKK
ncbi:serine hydrolase [Mucilaginibacter aquatilis]|uniref:Serine hydrolase n=1 Tax=Mucilaginibacter aquatilis TaxID=1517760 RepID=A0A6I4IFW3_9SPHI|nr:serine hydrolase [Mucilaginibacter aquatilis]MVN92259.1 serine hydrolase [Mucilaginibacter aquatilis]